MSEENENGNEIVVKVIKEKEEKTETDRELEKFKREAELEEENEQLKEKLALIAENAFENKKRELGCRDPEITTPDQLKAWEKGKSNSEDGSAGSAPLSRGQITGGDSSVGWNSHEEMIEDLLRTKHNGNDEERKIAQRVLGELMLKSLRGVKEQEKGIKPYVASKDSESVIERLNRFRREKELKRRSEGY